MRPRQTCRTLSLTFRVNRLQFVVSVTPGIFQNLMDSLIKGILGVTSFFDDVLIAASNTVDFATCLRTDLQRFQLASFKVKREKCLLGVPCIEFLGFTVDADGIHTAKDKVGTICSAPVSKNKTEFQAFLGLLNFYHAFLPHKALVAEPLKIVKQTGSIGLAAALGHCIPGFERSTYIQQSSGTL